MNFSVNCCICGEKIIFNTKKINKDNLIKILCPQCENIMFFELQKDKSLKIVF